MQLWAGAHVIDPNKTEPERMRAAFHCGVVSGRISNLYSERDAVLSKIFTRLHPGEIPVGSQRIFEDIPRDEDGKLGTKRALNVDVKKEAGGHLGYKDGCLAFFPKIDSAY